MEMEGYKRQVFNDPAAWFKALSFDAYDDFWDVYAIYHTLTDYDSGYGYDIERTDEGIVVSPYDEVYPILKTTEDGRRQLINELDRLYDGFDGVDSYDFYLHAIEKDD